MSLYYLILWNQVDILQNHFKKDHVHMCLWTRFYGREREKKGWWNISWYKLQTYLMYTSTFNKNNGLYKVYNLISELNKKLITCKITVHAIANLT